MEIATLAIWGGLAAFAILLGIGIRVKRKRPVDLTDEDFTNSPFKIFKTPLTPAFLNEPEEDSKAEGESEAYDFEEEVEEYKKRNPRSSTSIGAGGSRIVKRAKAKASAAKSPNNALGQLNIDKAALYENIPEIMVLGVPDPIEISIAKEQDEEANQAIKRTFKDAKTHDILAGAVMGVKLVDRFGAFEIESVTPETQWVDREQCQQIEDLNFASWRWIVTPRKRGKMELAIVVSMRTVNQDGLIGDMAFPEQVIPVKVRINYPQTIGSVLKWTGTLLVGAIAGHFVQTYLQ